VSREQVAVLAVGALAIAIVLFFALRKPRGPSPGYKKWSRRVRAYKQGEAPVEGKFVFLGALGVAVGLAFAAGAIALTLDPPSPAGTDPTGVILSVLAIAGLGAGVQQFYVAFSRMGKPLPFTADDPAKLCAWFTYVMVRECSHSPQVLPHLRELI